MAALPIDEVLPQILAALHRHPAVVVQAPPGAGKTTRVPLALLGDPSLSGSRILMLEPRRLAAANAAGWMAACRGEKVGGTVGYTIRFERKVSAATRIEVVTEGILSRRMQADPALPGVGVVIFDEFHERSLHADLALALCRDVQSGLREDLKIVVMSATIDCGPVAAMLGDAPVIRSEGRSFPVEVRYAPQMAARAVQGFAGDPLADVVPAVLKGATSSEGDLLVFLPGAGEILRCRTLLKGRPELSPFLICPLYGDLPFAAQELAIRPVPGRRRIILATNIAETSLTIEGVRTVVDSGWCRRLRFDPATGLNRLVRERVSAASADQRSGRAGRLGPGVCYRLWTQHEQRTLIPFDPPEIRTADLASLALDLALWGLSDPGSLSWLDPPPAAGLAEAQRLLTRLEALDSRGRITAAGRKMAELPVHPRLAHLLLVARERGAGALGADLAALLSERDIFRGDRKRNPRHATASDLFDRVEALQAWRHGQSAGGDLDEAACGGIDRTARQLRSILKAGEGDRTSSPQLAGILLARAYPDRLARQREPGSRRYLLASGQGATLTEQSGVVDEPLVVAVNVEGSGSEGNIRMASAISLGELRREFAAAITSRRVVEWDPREGRVVPREEERYESLVLGSRSVAATAAEIRRALLQGIGAGPGIDLLNWTPEALQFVSRIRFLDRLCPGEFPDFSPEALTATLDTWLGPFVDGVRSLAELAKADLLAPLRAQLSFEQQKKADAGAPTHLAVPSGSRIRIDYGSEEGPVLAVKLQELFGLADTPAVGWGRTPLLLHLLSPAGRPIQVTRDLRNFWNTGYREVKKELKGRYPRHPWPDDPWGAVPTRFTKKRGS